MQLLRNGGAAAAGAAGARIDAQRDGRRGTGAKAGELNLRQCTWRYIKYKNGSVVRPHT